MLTFQEILACTKGRVIGALPGRRLSSVGIDSRSLRPGALFVAIRGDTHDGHRFCRAAQKAGALAAVVSRPVPGCRLPLILVKDTTLALGQIAHAYRQKFSIPVIAITGSAGKTTVKDMVAGLLSKKYRVLKTEKNLNNQYGLPLMLLRLKPRHQVAVLELGINRKGDMAYLGKMAAPTMAVFTNIGASHLAGLQSLAGVAREKCRLAAHVAPGGTVLFNGDDPYLKKYLASRKTRRFSIDTPSACRARDRYLARGRQRFSVNGKAFTIKGLGKHDVYNALTAILCGTSFKVGYNTINTYLKSFGPNPNRGSWSRAGSLWLLDDTYNANPLSFQAALDTFRQRRVRGRHVVVCGDMLELGPKEKQLHQALARLFNRVAVDSVLTFGRLARQVGRALNPAIFFYHAPTRGLLHKKLKTFLKPGDAVLIKGSRSMHMEETVRFLKEEFA